VFFVFFGLQTNPADLPPVAGPALLLAVAGVATKLATGAIAARRAGIGPARAGTALIPRGEFNIVIAGLAVAASVNPRLGPLPAGCVLVLAVTGPLAARAVERLTRILQHRRAGQPHDHQPDSSDVP